MTLEYILDNLTFNNITTKQAYDELQTPDKRKLINYFINKDKIDKNPLKNHQLSQLTALVGILQILYNSGMGRTPIPDSDYDILQEMLINYGIPRLSGSVEINDSKKESHKYMRLRGTLNKCYYLFPDEIRTNKSRKYLDEWIKSEETRYEKITGKKISLNDEKVILTPKFDGASCIMEIDNTIKWLTRGDTKTNRASDVTHIMKIFNDVYNTNEKCGIKFEVMMTEENKDKINTLFKSKEYKNSRQIVTATLNSNEADYKVDYLYPIPLRILKEGEEIEQIHPDLIDKFPTEVCLLSDREKIKSFAKENKWVLMNGMRFRTDGIVITILNPEVQKVLGRDNDINNFEIALKSTEEYGYSTVRDIEFYVSEFGWITPVLKINDIILKGNTINSISLSNKERFDELFFSYGDKVKILYDITPYATRDEKCDRVKHGRKIEFIKHCPKCQSELDLDVVQVQCKNLNCPARLVGRILNYCTSLNIDNIGYNTLETLYENDFLKNGIRSLYKLKKKKLELEELEGFGRLKVKKIVSEIESKRRLKDYEFFGAIGIESLSDKTFQSIFSIIPYKEFLDIIESKDFHVLMDKLISIKGIAEKKADVLINWLKDSNNRRELIKLIEELSIFESYGESSKEKIVFSGFRDKELKQFLESKGYEVSDSLTNKTSYLIVKNKNDETSKILQAKKQGIKILSIEEAMKNIGKSI